MLSHDMICGDLLTSGSLVRPLTGEAEMLEAYYLIVSENARDIRGAKAFADWLCATLERDHRGLDATQA